MITNVVIGSFHIRSFVIVCVLLFPLCVSAQIADSTQSNPTPISDGHSPTSALLRSAVLPGWGQAYNRQYLKVPVVVAILGGLTAVAVNNHKEFRRYNRAYLFGAYIDEDPHPFAEFESDYAEFSGVTLSSIRSRRDLLRRNRDLTIIGLFLAYSLNLLDAYVSGHLYDFDVSEDLSVINPIRPSAMTVSLHIQL